MSLESFYGGKQGLSSVIKKAFKYISENDPIFARLTPEQKQEAILNEEVMEVCLQQRSYEDVWYGELCIIDTDNKNNPANGCLFRRTLAGQGSDFPIQIYRLTDVAMLGDNLGKLSAEYIGQIVGPQSGTPFVEFGNIEMVNEKAAEELGPMDMVAYQKTDDQTEEGYRMSYTALQEGESVYEHIANYENLFVPGYTTDEIRYAWCNVRDNSKDTDTQSWMYLGFQIPYLSVDWTFHTTDFYVNPTYENTYAADGENPKTFWQDWHIEVPRGVRGNAASKIKITTLEETPKVYQDFAEVIKQKTGTLDNREAHYFEINNNAAVVNESFIKTKVPYSTAIDDNFNYLKVPFFAYEYTIYNDFTHAGTSSGESVYIFMGMDKDIKNFTLAANGVITAHYNNLTKQQINPVTPIIWIDKIVAYPANDESENAGHLHITYNNPTFKPDYDIDLALVRGANFNTGTGKITFNRTDGSSFELEGPAIEYPHSLSLIGDIDANGINKDEDRDIKVTSNLEDAVSMSLGSPINYIQDIVITTDFHLCVLFNDKNHRTPAITNIPNWTPGGATSSGMADDNGNYWRIGLTGSDGKNYGNSVYWRDYGKILQNRQGLLYGYHLELIASADNSTYTCNFIDKDGNAQTVVVNAGDKAAIINSILLQKWPNGLPVLQSPIFEGDISIPGNEGYFDLRGMLVTAIMKDVNNIEITYSFGYDYENYTWECIQESASANQVDAVIDDNALEYVFRPSSEGMAFNTWEVEDIDMQGELPAPWIIEGYYTHGQSADESVTPGELDQTEPDDDITP